MPLIAGVRLGPYEIVSAIGAGGMGEVYRARDTRLDRTVAIKVLPEDLAADPQFRERFDREARAISQLTHPNICTLYDVGEHPSATSTGSGQAGSGKALQYLVMEYLEGETLAEKLASGAGLRAVGRERAGPGAQSPQPKAGGLPVSEALNIASQIADALAAAHRQGIVHRDLKPGNVMLVKSGGSPQAKLLDFGLAKAAGVVHGLGPAVRGGPKGQPDSHTPTSLPTTPPQAITAQGTILGTFQYMAPEQIEGQDADARTDIFAFGCVLYEMLTGKRAFEGKTQTSLIAAILEREPPSIVTVQPLAPPLVDSIVRRCLAKSPDDRWQSAADLGSALRWAADGANAFVSAPAAAPAIPQHSGRRAARFAVAVVAALVVFAAGGAVGWRYVSTAIVPAATIRFEVVPPPDAELSPSPIASAAQLALSPDGRRLAFVAAAKRGASQIWIRPLDGVQAQPLPGTDGASFPFWSPDSRSIAFFAGGKLKKIDTTGGVPQVLCDAAGGRGGAWSAAGVIVFTGQPNSPMSRVSAAGGVATPATTLDPEQAVVGHNWPQFLPDGRHVLYYQRSLKPEYQGVYVTALDSSESTQVLPSSGMAVHVPGFLLFVRDGTLFAQPFDDGALQTSDEPVHVADHVGYWGASFGYAAVTASGTGALAHGPSVALTTSLRWHDRGGATAGPQTAPGAYSSPRLSPDQKSVIVAIADTATAQPDLWMLEVARGATSRVTSDRGNDWFPLWSSDASRIFFGSSRAGAATTLFQKAGSAQEDVLADSVLMGSVATYPTDASNDGRFVLYQQATTRGYDLGTLPLSEERKPSAFLATPFNEVQGRFSPNNRWVAYASDESGKFEVYVRPFPASSTQSTTISVAGGMQPEWRRDGKELFFIAADGKLTAVPVTTDGTTFSAGASRPLFDVQIPEATAPYATDYAVTADGQRFLVNTIVDQPTRPALTVILNWTAELKK